jgi:hypothetical protein
VRYAPLRACLFIYTGNLLQRVKLATLRAILGPVKKAYKDHRLVRQSISHMAIRGYDPQADVKDRTFLDHLLHSSKGRTNMSLLNFFYLKYRFEGSSRRAPEHSFCSKRHDDIAVHLDHLHLCDSSSNHGTSSQRSSRYCPRNSSTHHDGFATNAIPYVIRK